MVIHRDVARRAHADPARPAVLVDPGVVTFGDLADRAADRASGLASGDLVVTSDDPITALVDLLAANSVGASAILADPAWSTAERAWAIERAASAPRGALVHFDRHGDEIRPIVRKTTSWTWSYPAFSVYIGVDPADTVAIPSLTGFLYEALHALTMGAAIRFGSRADANGGVNGHAYGLSGPLRTRGDARYLFTPELAVLAMEPVQNGGLRAFPGVDIVVRQGRLHARTPYAADTVEKDADGFADSGIDGAAISETGVLTLPVA